MWARVDKQEILLAVALSFHYINWFSTFFFLLLLFEYPQILIPIPSFTNKGIHIWSELKGGQRQVNLLHGSAINCLTGKTKAMKLPTDRGTTLFSRRGPWGTPASPSPFEGTMQQDTGNSGDSLNALIPTFFSKFQRIHHERLWWTFLSTRRG